ncbi:hypothetical protein Tco_1159822, partial [Tanacetum coccineum]
MVAPAVWWLPPAVTETSQKKWGDGEGVAGSGIMDRVDLGLIYLFCIIFVVRRKSSPEKFSGGGWPEKFSGGGWPEKFSGGGWPEKVAVAD